MKRMPIIMDVDTGIDDAVAIMLALSSEKLDVKGITVVAGNQTIDKTLYNTLAVVQYLKKSEIPVARGAEKPLMKPQIIAGETHGETGLGTAKLPAPTIKENELDAVSFLRKTLEESDEKITLVPVGPLTNIALLFLSYPHVKEKIEKIVVMGGGAFEGNASAVTEFNIIVDPEAAKIVFDSGVPIVMCGLDVTMRAYTTKGDIKKIKDTNTIAGDFCAKAFEHYYDMYVKNSYLDGCAVHDAVAISYLINKEIIKTKSANIKVDIDGAETYGCTATDLRPTRNINDDNALVCLDINREIFVDMLIKACESYK